MLGLLAATLILFLLSHLGLVVTLPLSHLVPLLTTATFLSSALGHAQAEA